MGGGQPSHVMGTLMGGLWGGPWWKGNFNRDPDGRGNCGGDPDVKKILMGNLIKEGLWWGPWCNRGPAMGIFFYPQIFVNVQCANVPLVYNSLFIPPLDFNAFPASTIDEYLWFIGKVFRVSAQTLVLLVTFSWQCLSLIAYTTC